MAYLTPKNGGVNKKRKSKKLADALLMETDDLLKEKKPKKEVLYDDESEVNDDMKEEADDSSSVFASQQNTSQRTEAISMDPIVIKKQFDSFFDFVEKENSSNLTGDSMFKNVFNKWLEQRKKEVDIDNDKDLHRAMLSITKSALHMKYMSFDVVKKLCLNFLDQPVRIEEHPDFPKQRFHTKIMAYAHIKKIKMAMVGVGSMKDITTSMKSDPAGVAKAEKKYNKDQESYLEDLKLFLENHCSQLSEKQSEFLKQKIARLNKKLHPEPRIPKTPGAPKTPGSGRGKKHKTAFELFYDLENKTDAKKKKMAVGDLSDEDLAKWQEKYDALEPSSKDIYERLAVRGV